MMPLCSPNPRACRLRWKASFALLVSGLLLTQLGSAGAQLPTATGRQLALQQSAWRLFIPTGVTPRADGTVDLLVHFHGESQTVWNNAAYAKLNAAIVTVNYNGLSSAYSTPFAQASLFQTLLNSAASTLAAQPDFGVGTSWGQLAVSSFSAGYGAVRQILASPTYRNQIDSLLAADSLYATTASDGTALDSQMAGYKAFADLAATGQKRFVFSHSQVPTYTYESTAETGDELLAHLGLATAPTSQTGLGDLRFYRTTSRQGFSLWGALGTSGDSHLSHLRYMGEWLDELGLSTLRKPGDFNDDGWVDVADYTVWRDGLGAAYPLQGYTEWSENYDGGPRRWTAVPEPSAVGLTALLCLMATSLCHLANRSPR
ncbi:hypothetical protein [Botrimarina hoheduenensis]|uniref:Alpha/beta hydrolase family protein n=1 Tax=Botrimarina hoheduenensis TaxID=2528000 RepID=A0A5C5WD89_9BACT|nr:hypothetical protein [Botrimarina hoheduenensis]TWT47632.1 hypothetical protein Pla111_12480 [Botrimarina hoheduenensis]